MSTSDHFSSVFAQVPVGLRQQVNGETNEAAFRFVGWEIFKGIQRTLAVDQNLFKANKILDLGAGLGRLSLPLLEGATQAEVTVCEQDESLLHWTRQLLSHPRARFAADTETLASGNFELITAISFFTHLDTTTEYWLAEIDRLLSEDGVAFITYQDEKLFKDMKGKGAVPAEAECRERYVLGAGGRETSTQMSTFYKSTHWRSLLARHFEVTVINPRGLFGHQSISAIRRKKSAHFDREKLRREHAAYQERVRAAV